MRKASTQLVLVVAIVQGLMFANRKHLYDSSRMVVTNVRAQAYGSNPSKLTSPAVSVQPLPAFRGPDSGVGQSHLTNRPIVHSPLMNASLPPVHARKIPGSTSRVSGLIRRRNLRAAGFARVVAWERTQVVGRRLVVVVQRVVEVIGVGGVVGRRALVVGRGGTGGFEQRNWHRISFKVS